jgi:Domain of unknown function (DUF4136)
MCRLQRLVIVLLLALVAGCASGPAVLVDRDPTADLAAYRTFAFFDRADTDSGRYSTILTQHLRRATRAQLERLGYVYDERAPQLKVNFLLNVEERQELRTSPSSLGFVGPRGYRVWRGYDVDTVSYKAGTLRIDLVDASRSALVWQGVAQGRVGGDALRNPGSAIDRVVAEVFSNFPGEPAR